jgi:hypothetical protein
MLHHMTKGYADAVHLAVFQCVAPFAPRQPAPPSRKREPTAVVRLWRATRQALSAADESSAARRLSSAAKERPE